jgi:hypothetical protein
VRSRVDLSLGRQVPVIVEDPIATPAARRTSAVTPVVAPTSSFLRFAAQPRTQREL